MLPAKLCWLNWHKPQHFPSVIVETIAPPHVICIHEDVNLKMKPTWETCMAEKTWEKWRSHPKIHPASGCSICLLQCELNFLAFVTEGLYLLKPLKRDPETYHRKTRFWGPEELSPFLPKIWVMQPAHPFFPGNSSGTLRSVLSSLLGATMLVY